MLRKLLSVVCLKQVLICLLGLLNVMHTITNTHAFIRFVPFICKEFWHVVLREEKYF